MDSRHKKVSIVILVLLFLIKVANKAKVNAKKTIENEINVDVKPEFQVRSKPAFVMQSKPKRECMERKFEKHKY